VEDGNAAWISCVEQCLYRYIAKQTKSALTTTQPTARHSRVLRVLHPRLPQQKHNNSAGLAWLAYGIVTSPISAFGLEIDVSRILSRTLEQLLEQISTSQIACYRTAHWTQDRPIQDSLMLSGLLVKLELLTLLIRSKVDQSCQSLICRLQKDLDLAGGICFLMRQRYVMTLLPQ
jgi:hypothetical protein